CRSPPLNSFSKVLPTGWADLACGKSKARVSSTSSCVKPAAWACSKVLLCTSWLCQCLKAGSALKPALCHAFTQLLSHSSRCSGSAVCACSTHLSECWEEYCLVLKTCEVLAQAPSAKTRARIMKNCFGMGLPLKV